MSLAFYFDEHVPSAIAEGARQRRIDVLTVQEDGFEGADDAVLLDRADELGRIMFTRDDDFVKEAAIRLGAGRSFTTVICANQNRVSIRQSIDDLELFAAAANAEEARDHVYYLPLR